MRMFDDVWCSLMFYGYSINLSFHLVSIWSDTAEFLLLDFCSSLRSAPPEACCRRAPTLPSHGKNLTPVAASRATPAIFLWWHRLGDLQSQSEKWINENVLNRGFQKQLLGIKHDKQNVHQRQLRANATIKQSISMCIIMYNMIAVLN